MSEKKAEYSLDKDWFGGMNEGDFRYYKSDALPIFYKIDAGVKKVLDFMLREIRWEDLRGVAEAVSILAPSVFAGLPYSEIRPVLFRYGPEEKCFVRPETEKTERESSNPGGNDEAP